MSMTGARSIRWVSVYSQVPNKWGGGVKINGGGWEFFEKFNI